MHAGFEAGIHDRQILIGQGHVDNHFRLDLTDQLDEVGGVVRIDLFRADGPVQRGGNGITFALGPAGQHDLVKDLGHLHTFMNHDIADPAGADNQYL